MNHIFLTGQSIVARTQSTAREVMYEELPGTDGLLSVVHNVEICAVGIEYPLASGPKTFTPEDLLQAVASQDDPAIQAPRVWLGHPDDQRFHAGRTSPVGSAEPALGKVTGMRVEDEGMVLVGDVMGCPTWLAKILASAYPSRSIEGFQNAETVTGQKWDLVITDLALLGVVWPGVTTLEDLSALYSAEGPEGVEVKEDEVSIAAARGRVFAQSALEKVRMAFVAALPDLDIPGWPWIRAILQDPNELIVDDDEGGLWMVAYDAANEDDIKFSAPVKKKIQYVNASQKRDPHARTLLANMLTDGRQVAASWEDRTASRPDNDPGGHSMTPEQLRANLGLPADATDEQVQARLQELQAAAGGPSPDQTGEPGSRGPDAPPDPATVTPPAQPGAPSTAGVTPEAPSPDQAGEAGSRGPVAPPVAASGSLPEGMVAVPAEAWASMQSSVQTISARNAQDEVAADERLVAQALQDGKFYPYQRDYYLARIKDANTRDAFRHLLTAAPADGGLMANLVPITARGGDTPVDAQADAYPADWLPEVKQGGTATITTEG